ncbi:MJ0042-type zinc finger domain-containing protein [Nocardia gipuzkoensis]|uniref:MJ0042-type zinc finger domain-containing protein n=1 Tax=Nocardia gipuzkoensis TaxID=2749991 RepID=UPI003B8A6B09
MRATQTSCPRCGAALLVDTSLFGIGTVRLRCGQCTHYFLPAGSPHDIDVQRATNANVPIDVWEPALADDLSDRATGRVDL